MHRLDAHLRGRVPCCRRSLHLLRGSGLSCVRVPEVCHLGLLQLPNGPWPRKGSRGMAMSPLRCSLPFAVDRDFGQNDGPRCVQLSLLYSRFNEHRQRSCRPGWRRRHSSPGHKAGTLTVFDAGVSGRSVSFNAQRGRLPEGRARAPPKGAGRTGRVVLDGGVAEVSARSSTVTWPRSVGGPRR